MSADNRRLLVISPRHGRTGLVIKKQSYRQAFQSLFITDNHPVSVLPIERDETQFGILKDADGKSWKIVDYLTVCVVERIDGRE